MSINSTDLEHILDYIRGKINEQTYSTINNNKPKNKLMIFVSSTFTDTVHERDTLHEIILPALQQKANQEDIQVILYDMRFGVKDENTLDHLTWIACREAIEQCYEESDGMFFLSLQGDKYGFMLLPKYLEKEAFEEALKKHAAEEGYKTMEDLALEWYLLDENYVKPQYELKGLKVMDHKGFWKNAMSALRDHLFNSFPFELLSLEPKKELLVNRSVTEWETLFALEKDKKRCFWMHREFENSLRALVEKNRSARSIEFLCDGLDDPAVKLKHETLIREMQRSLLPSQICRFIDIVPTFGTDKNNLEKNVTYLMEWQNAAYNQLNMEIETVIAKKGSWANLILELGLSVNYFEEIVHHNNIARSKSNAFIGREGIVDTAMDLLTMIKQSQELESRRLEVALYVVGVSGAGKTAFMSKLAIEFQNVSNIDNVPVVVRYCGTSTYSLHGKDLVQSISMQILCIYGKKDTLKDFIGKMGEQKYEEAVGYFGSLMLEFPVCLFIDSLDQLSNRDEARRKLSFLKDVKLHEKSRIVVSTLPDEKDTQTGEWKYLFFCEQRLKENAIPRIEIGMIDNEKKEEIQQILEKLLERRGKRLSPHQWRVVVNAAVIEPTMLYLNLSMEVISKWRSFEIDVILTPTVKGLIHQIFDDLERQYGRHFTRYALGLITYSRDGINDIEMKDCLSLQKEVLEEVFQYSTLKSFPLHVWLRLKGALKHVFAEKENHCMKWYHRQLWETAAERYLSIKRNCHEIMGRYFGNLVHEEEKREKRIRSQELTVNNVIVWLPSSKINTRRVREAYYHLVEAKMIKEAAEEMCSLEFVCASAIIKDGYNLVSYLGQVRSKTDSFSTRIDDYFVWIQKEMSRILSNPRFQVSNTAGEEPMISTIYQENLQRFNKLTGASCSTEDAVYTMTLHGKRTKDLLLSNWQEKYLVHSVSWNHDGSKIASGSNDWTIKIWDATTGEVISTLEGHSKDVNSVSWNHDGSKIASGSEDNTIKIWDATTGEVISTLEGHSKDVNSVSWNHDGSKIASGSDDNTIKIWDATTGEVINTLEGHSDWVTSVSWNHDGSKIASGSFDNTIKIWDATTGEVISTLEGHSGSVFSVSWNHDGSKIALGSGDKTIKIWDATTGEVISTLEGHSGSVNSVFWNHDGSKIASGSDDNTIKVWDAVTGEVISTLEGHIHWVNSVSWNHDGSKIASGSDDWTIKIWDATTGEVVSTLEGHSGGVNSVSWNHDGSKIASGSVDNTIKIWDATTGEVINTLEGHSKDVFSVSWNHDGSKIASGSNDWTIKIWDATTGEVKSLLEGHSGSVFSVSWNHDGSKIASGLLVRTIRIRDATTGEVISTLEGHSGSVKSVSWNHDGSKIASGSEDNTIKIWDATTGEVISTLEGHSKDVNSVSWNHDGSKIASGSVDNTIKIWDATTGEVISTLEGHSGSVKSVSWNHDGSKIASGSLDNTIKIWDATTGEVISTLEGHSGSVRSVSWNHDGSKIASGSDDNTVKNSSAFTFS